MISFKSVIRIFFITSIIFLFFQFEFARRYSELYPSIVYPGFKATGNKKDGKIKIIVYEVNILTTDYIYTIDIFSGAKILSLNGPAYINYLRKFFKMYKLNKIELKEMKKDRFWKEFEYSISRKYKIDDRIINNVRN